MLLVQQLASRPDVVQPDELPPNVRVSLYIDSLSV